MCIRDRSRNLTTFLLESGRFRYRKAPMGLASSSDEFCHRSDAAFAGHEGTMKIVDDGITAGSTLEQLEKRLRALLTSCRKHNVTLSEKKFKIGDDLKFAGHMIGAKGIRPDPEKVASIRNFPAPKTLTELRSFLGLANQLGAFLPDLAHLAAPLRPLTKKDIAFQWLPAHQSAFEKLKQTLTSDLSLIHI